MSDFKVRCVESTSLIRCKPGDVFEFKNGRTVWNNGMQSGCYSNVEKLNSCNLDTVFELIPEPQQFTKDMLKTGMRVELRNGFKLVVMLDTEKGDIIANYEEVWMPLKDYSCDLSCKPDSGWSISKVFSMASEYSVTKAGYRGQLLWQRPEIPKMTHKELESIVGHEFKYVKE